MSNDITLSGEQELYTNTNGQQSNYVCTFDMEDDEQKLQALSAYNDAEPLSEHVGEVIHLANVLTSPGVRKSRISGVEDAPCQNTYLIDTEGNAYFSQSDGVASSVNMLVAAFPNMSYKGQGYVDVKCTEKTLSNGNRMKSIVPVTNSGASTGYYA